MIRVAQFQIGFRDENQGVVSYQHLAGGEVAGDYLAAVSFASFALRSWRSMGKGNVFANASAGLIHTLSDPTGALKDIRALPHPSDRDLGYLVGRLKEATPLSSIVVRELLQMYAERRAEFQVAEEDSNAGMRRRFVGTVEARGRGYTLHLDAKGFGITGSGLNYYAPAAVFLLLHHLAASVVRDETSRERLGEVARQSAKMWIVDDRVGIGNQPDLVLQLMSEVWPVH